MDRNSVVYQYYATFCVNLIAINYGIACGWPSPTFPELSSNDSRLKSGPLSPLQLSWIVSTMCIGGFVGTLVFGWMTNSYGRKRPMILLAIPAMISWVLTILAQNVYFFILARFLIGFCGGGSFVVLPMYVSEISEDRVRGTLSSKMILCCNIGILSAYTLGNYLSYEVAASVYFMFPLMFLIGVYFLPETPYYLMRTRRETDAEKSLAYYRNVGKNPLAGNENFKVEMDKLRKQTFVSDKEKTNEMTSALCLTDFTSRAAIKALLIGSGLVLLNQMSGLFAMMNYTSTIFKEAGSSLSPNMSAIIVGAIQLVGSIISSYLCDKAGRKILLAVSSIGSCVGLAVMGAHMLWFNVPSLNWVPVASFSFVIFVCNFGVLTLPFVVVTEIMPEKIRSAGVSFCMSLLWFFAFIASKFFYQLSLVLGMHGCMFLFSGACLIGTFFIILCVPETKGKSLEEIQKLLQ